jgi:hypothetical protein
MNWHALPQRPGSELRDTPQSVHNLRSGPAPISGALRPPEAGRPSNFPNPSEMGHPFTHSSSADPMSQSDANTQRKPLQQQSLTAPQHHLLHCNICVLHNLQKAIL